MRLALTAVVLGVSAALAQQAPPARDAAAQPTTGSASLSGIVVTDEATPRPVRRAVVTLSADTLRPSRSAVTDDEGRFAIGGLPHGRYTLAAARAGFVTSAFGARRPGRPGTALALEPGDNRTNIVIRIWRGAIVAGVVRDISGEPAAGVPVDALPARGRTSSGLLTLSNNGATTNERGEFRIFGLVPNSYLVVARVSGGGTPSVELAETQIEAVLEWLRRRTGVPAGPGAPPPLPSVPYEPFSLAPVYYPGTTVIAQAQPIHLSPGDEVLGLDFTLQRLRTYEVAGVLQRDDGRSLVGTSVQLEAVAAPGPFHTGDVARFRTAAGADGSFRFAAVPPGDYRLLARAPVEGMRPSRFETTVQPGFDGATLIATTDVTVGGAPVTGLSLTLGSPLSMTGRVVFDGAPLEPATALARVQIAFLPPEMLAPGPGRSIDTLAVARPAAVQPDGTFRIDGIVPGVHAVGVMGPLATSGWWLRSAMLDGRDLADGHVDVTPGMNLSGVVVTFTDRHPELSGTLQTAGGEAVSDVFVIAYSADRSQWGPGTRRVQAVRPGIDGRYTIVGLPPGQYLLAALTDVDEGDWQDPAFLEQLVPGSIPIGIGEGERKVQDLRVGR